MMPIGRARAKRGLGGTSSDELFEIYERQCWDAVECDQLPAGVDYVVFDDAVKSGRIRTEDVYDFRRQQCASPLIEPSVIAWRSRRVRHWPTRTGLTERWRQAAPSVSHAARMRRYTRQARLCRWAFC